VQDSAFDRTHLAARTPKTNVRILAPGLQADGTLYGEIGARQTRIHKTRHLLENPGRIQSEAMVNVFPVESLDVTAQPNEINQKCGGDDAELGRCLAELVRIVPVLGREALHLQLLGVHAHWMKLP
jgi:hypothetical protein